MRRRKGMVLFLAMAIAAGMLLQGCQHRADPLEGKSLSGAYQYGESITEDSLYADSEESPVFVFTETDLVLFQRDLAHYSPRSSLGRYYGSQSTYSQTEIKAIRDPLALLADAGVDTSDIQSCRGYAVSENQLAYFLVDGQIWVMQYQGQRPFVFSVRKAEQLELQTIDLNLASEEEVALIDTAAPKMLDIEDASVTEHGVLKAIGVSDRDAGILVACNRWTECRSEYIVYEFEGDTLRSRAEYRFHSSDDGIYNPAKVAAAMANGACNDALRLLKTTYAYDVDLQTEYQGLNYDQLGAALNEARGTIIHAVTPNYKSLAPFSFADLSPLEFWFASGAGGWCTILTVHDDGTFEGEYRDSDMGSMRLCNFTGKLSEPVKVNDYTYSVKLEQIKLAREPGGEAWRDGIKITYSVPYGLDDADELLFYLPGAPVEALPEGYRNWMETYGDYIGTELPFYGLYNVSGEEGYSSHISDELRALDASAQAAYEDLLSGDFSLLDGTQRHLYLTAHSGEWEYTTMDLDGDGVSELLIQYIDEPSYYNAVFHYADGKVTCWNNDDIETSCRDYPLRDGTMVSQYDYSGTRSYSLFRYRPDGEREVFSTLFARDELLYDDGQPPCPYYKIDDVEVDEATFNAKLEALIVRQLLDRWVWTTI